MVYVTNTCKTLIRKKPTSKRSNGSFWKWNRVSVTSWWRVCFEYDHRALQRNTNFNPALFASTCVVVGTLTWEIQITGMKYRYFSVCFIFFRQKNLSSCQLFYIFFSARRQVTIPKEQYRLKYLDGFLDTKSQKFKNAISWSLAAANFSLYIVSGLSVHANSS